MMDFNETTQKKYVSNKIEQQFRPSIMNLKILTRFISETLSIVNKSNLSENVLKSILCFQNSIGEKLEIK